MDGGIAFDELDLQVSCLLHVPTEWMVVTQFLVVVAGILLLTIPSMFYNLANFAHVFIARERSGSLTPTRRFLLVTAPSLLSAPAPPLLSATLQYRFFFFHALLSFRTLFLTSISLVFVLKMLRALPLDWASLYSMSLFIQTVNVA